MKANFKDIHIGELIQKRVEESQIEASRISDFLNCSIEEVEVMYTLKSLDSGILLRWSKLLDYDFFRVYTQHLILYAPPSAEKIEANASQEGKSTMPQFRKNIYTKEVIDFILDLIQSGEKTKRQVIDEYRIPKTTLYKWIDKYQS